MLFYRRKPKTSNDVNSYVGNDTSPVTSSSYLITPASSIASDQSIQPAGLNTVASASSSSGQLSSGANQAATAEVNGAVATLTTDPTDPSSLGLNDAGL